LLLSARRTDGAGAGGFGEMKVWTPKTRRVLLLFASALCVAGGAAVLFTQFGDARLSRASTGELAALLGLFVHPGMTLASARFERRLRRERRRGR